MYHILKTEQDVTDWMNETIVKARSGEAEFSEARELALLTLELLMDYCPESIVFVDFEEYEEAFEKIGAAHDILYIVIAALSGNHPELAGTLWKFKKLLEGTRAAMVNFYSGGASGENGKRKTYIVKNPRTGKIKIGVSISPEDRINTLGLASGERLTTLAIIEDDIEAQLHEYFAEYREHGEWFDDRDGKIAYFAINRAHC